MTYTFKPVEMEVKAQSLEPDQRKAVVDGRNPVLTEEDAASWRQLVEQLAEQLAEHNSWLNSSQNSFFPVGR